MLREETFSEFMSRIEKIKPLELKVKMCEWCHKDFSTYFDSRLCESCQKREAYFICAGFCKECREKLGRGNA